MIILGNGISRIQPLAAALPIGKEAAFLFKLEQAIDGDTQLFGGLGGRQRLAGEQSFYLGAIKDAIFAVGSGGVEKSGFFPPANGFSRNGKVSGDFANAQCVFVFAVRGHLKEFLRLVQARYSSG